MDLITEEALSIKDYIKEQWPQFDVQLEQRLNTLFPQPLKGCKHIWRHGTADIVVRRGGKIVAVIEPGGSHHFQDEKQMKNDRAKWKLCQINGVGCLRIANGVLDKLSKRKKRTLLGKYLFPRAE